ncbi:MAG TPA: hypothetical protein VJ483_03475 [Holophagaceae bacterium]|nr:hypothetical protein [Holophagaceae bacterium]
MRLRALSTLLLPALVLSAGGHRRKVGGTVHTAKEAKTIAEKETGGIAVSARQIQLNGASGGWEVDLHMPKDDRGWRCVIDDDTHMVYTKTRIDNPPAPRHRR